MTSVRESLRPGDQAAGLEAPGRTLRRARELGRLAAKCRPVVHLESGALEGIEIRAQARDLASGGGLGSAELGGAAVPVGRWLLLESMLRAAELGTDTTVVVPVLAAQLGRKGFADSLLADLDLTASSRTGSACG